MANLSLPLSPTNGQQVTHENSVFTFDSTKNVWNRQPLAGRVEQVVPTSNTSVDNASIIGTKLVFAKADGTTSNVSLSSLASGTGTVYANESDLPTSGVTPGDHAFVSATGDMYIRSISQWRKIDAVNLTPSVSMSVSSHSFTADGESIDVTYTVNEPEGTPVTLTVANSGISASEATAVHHASNNTITITAGSSAFSGGVVTLSATDGVNIGNGVVNIDLTLGYAGAPARTFLLKGNDAGTTTPLNLNDGSLTVNEQTVGTPIETAVTPYANTGWSYYFEQYSSDIGNDAGDMANFTIGTKGLADTTTSEDWMLEFWINTVGYNNNLTASQQILAVGDPGNDPGSFALQVSGATGLTSSYTHVNGNNGGIMPFKHNVDTYKGSGARDNGRGLAPGGWNHICFVKRTGSSGSYNVYVDGRCEVMHTHNSNFTDVTLFSRFLIGGNKMKTSTTDWSTDNVSAGGFTGWMSDMRLEVGTLSRSIGGEAEGVQVFDKPTEHLETTAATRLHILNNPFLRDISSNNDSYYPNLGTTRKDQVGTHIVEDNGRAPGYGTYNYQHGPKAFTFSPFGHDEYNPLTHGGSMYFDGASKYQINLGATPGATANVYPSGDHTISFWIKPEEDTRQHGSYYRRIFQFGYDGNGPELFLANESRGGLIYNLGLPSGATITSGGFDGTGTYVKLGRWTHVALVHNTSIYPAETKMFINGQQVGDHTTHYVRAQSWNTSTSTKYNAIVFGGSNAGGGSTPINNLGNGMFKGYIADFRWEPGQKYTTRFTPPSSLEATGNSLIRLAFNKSKIYDARNNHAIEYGGAVSTSTSVVSRAPTSIRIDGTTDPSSYIKVKNLNSSISPQQYKGFTIEMNVRFDALRAGQEVWNWFGWKDGWGLRLRTWESGGVHYLGFQGGDYQYSGNSFPRGRMIGGGNQVNFAYAANTWYNIVLVIFEDNPYRKREKAAMYVNGVRAQGVMTVFNHNNNTELAHRADHYIQTNMPANASKHMWIGNRAQNATNADDANGDLPTTEAMTGYISDLSITNGLNRYNVDTSTASITVPATKLI